MYEANIELTGFGNVGWGFTRQLPTLKCIMVRGFDMRFSTTFTANPKGVWDCVKIGTVKARTLNEFEILQPGLSAERRITTSTLLIDLSPSMPKAWGGD